MRQVERTAPDELTVFTVDGAALGDLLVAVGSRLDVIAIHAEQLTLHEIYVRSVEASLAGAAGGPPPGADPTRTRRAPAEVDA